MKQKQPSITSTAEFYETGTNIWKSQALQIDSLTTKQKMKMKQKQLSITSTAEFYESLTFGNH